MRVRRQLAPFEDRQPPRIIGSPNAHMIRHDVEQELQIMVRQRVREADESFLAAEFRIDLCRIDAVIAMGRARASLENRRRIDVANPKLREIGNDRARLIEIEIFVEL